MIKIGGLQKVTLLDYPGKVACAVFLVGCNFRCGFCHNPHLLDSQQTKETFSTDEFFDYLVKRQGKITSVCVSGGEPLLNQDIRPFLQKIKDLHYLIKLDTNGSNPALLAELIKDKLVDYIAMDIKASLDTYSDITGVKIDGEKIKKTLKIIMDSGLDYEFRTTVLPKYHNDEEMEKIGQLIFGAKIYYLQNFNNRQTLDPQLGQARSFKSGELEKLRQIALQYVQQCLIRN
jgi:pyruvate formate lyase activating enzyme